MDMGGGTATLDVVYLLGAYGERATVEAAAGPGIDVRFTSYDEIDGPEAFDDVDLILFESDSQDRDQALVAGLDDADRSVLAVCLRESDDGPPWYRSTVRPLNLDVDPEPEAADEDASLSWRRAEEHFYRTDRVGRFVSVNPAKADFHDSTPEAMVGKTDIDVFPLRSGLEFFLDNLLTIRTGEGQEGKLERVPDPSGGDRIVAASKYVRTDEDGAVVGLEGVSRDETRRVKTREKLRRTNENMRTFVGLVNHNLYNELQKLGGYVDGPVRDGGQPPTATVEDVYTAMTAKVDALSWLISRYTVDWSDGTTAYGLEHEFPVGDPLRAHLSATVAADGVTVRSERATVQTMVRQLDAELVDRLGEDYHLDVAVERATDGFAIVFAEAATHATDDGPLALPVLDRRGTEVAAESDVRRLLIRILADSLGWDVTVTTRDGDAIWHVDPDAWLAAFVD